KEKRKEGDKDDDGTNDYEEQCSYYSRSFHGRSSRPRRSRRLLQVVPVFLTRCSTFRTAISNGVTIHSVFGEQAHRVPNACLGPEAPATPERGNKHSRCSVLLRYASTSVLVRTDTLLTLMIILSLSPAMSSARPYSFTTGPMLPPQRRFEPVYREWRDLVESIREYVPNNQLCLSLVCDTRDSDVAEAVLDPLYRFPYSRRHLDSSCRAAELGAPYDGKKSSNYNNGSSAISSASSIPSAFFGYFTSPISIISFSSPSHPSLFDALPQEYVLEAAIAIREAKREKQKQMPQCLPEEISKESFSHSSLIVPLDLASTLLLQLPALLHRLFLNLQLLNPPAPSLSRLPDLQPNFHCPFLFFSLNTFHILLHSVTTTLCLPDRFS
ncbi:MAG: hypothetical protein LQ340_004875, partial [Diploschistes diacapsis]